MFIIKLSYNEAIPFLVSYPRDNEKVCSHKALYGNVHTALFIIAPKGKQLKCPLSDG